jgi:bacteriorhodopsin
MRHCSRLFGFVGFPSIVWLIAVLCHRWVRFGYLSIGFIADFTLISEISDLWIQAKLQVHRVGQSFTIGSGEWLCST